MKGRIVRLTVVGALAALCMVAARPAGAVHLFPLFPGDPTGDCGTGLEADPGTSDGNVQLLGFRFVDTETGTSTTNVAAGQSVTWTWEAFCHSVTFDGFGTFGGDVDSPVFNLDFEDELVKPDSDNRTFTLTFDQPGTYSYVCVHHDSVGMTGTIEVST